MICFYRRLPVSMIAGLLIIASCKLGNHPEVNSQNNKGKDSLAIKQAYSNSPVLTPEESLNHLKVEKGFTIKLVAAEPLVNSPVALLFDERARMWVLEMQGYMPDTLGTGEKQPRGKIVILEDSNRDGIADTRKVFLDSLVMPRAICFAEGGMLVAEPPRLWYVSNNNDVAGKKILVDSAYAEGGNVEHQPNGLMHAMDNWIYSANSGKRYRKKGGRWQIERTFSRGQWGISQDDYGRLFYNNNSENLLGDYFAPGFGATNPNQRVVAGYIQKIVADNKVYPARPTPGVNRGYQPGILDDSVRLVNFTAASGPVIYRGGLFGTGYQGNAFVGEPSANLIKRNIVNDSLTRVIGKQAYKGKEFVTSSDERFRPVTLYNGPDGALYVVDMYRGIIQHKTYLTPYLKSEIRLRKLTDPLTCGRIYKIVPSGGIVNYVTLPSSPDSLVNKLRDPNGWIRDKAQQMIIDGKFVNVAPGLRQQLRLTTDVIPAIHSLWTLEGLGALRPEDVLPLLQQSSWPLRMQALCVLPSLLNKQTSRQFLPLLEQMLNAPDSLAAPYITFLAQVIRPFNPVESKKLLLAAIKLYPKNLYVADAVISNLKDQETPFMKELEKMNPDTNLVLHKRLQKVIKDIASSKKNKNASMVEKEFPDGVALFKSVCQTCHGPDGNGIKSLAPPLNQSEWVTGDKSKLISIILYGLTGPVSVNGTLYQAPEINGEMPAMGNSADLTQDELAQVMSYIRKSWSNNAEKVSMEEIEQVRQTFKGRQKNFTMEELKKIR